MALMLTIDEMLEVALRANLPDYERFVAQAEVFANELADALAGHLQVVHRAGTWEGLEMAGLCVPFYAKHKGQACPKVFHGLDEGGEEDWSEFHYEQT